MRRTVPNSTVQPQQLRKHSKVSVAVTAMLQAEVCGPASYGVSILLSPVIYFPMPMFFLSSSYYFNGLFLPKSSPIHFRILQPACLASAHFCACGKGPAVCWCLLSYHATSSHHTRGKSVPRIYLSAKWDMKFQSSWGNREADTLLLNSVPPCRSQLLLTRTLSILHQTHEKNK